MSHETRGHEDRTRGHDQAGDGCEQLDDETAEDDRLGPPRIAHRAAEQDQPRRADRCHEDEGLELWVPSDGLLHGRLRGSPDLRIHRSGNEADGADQQRASCYWIAEQAGDGGGQSGAAHGGDELLALSGHQGRPPSAREAPCSRFRALAAGGVVKDRGPFRQLASRRTHRLWAPSGEPVSRGDGRRRQPAPPIAPAAGRPAAGAGWSRRPAPASGPAPRPC